VWWVTRVIRASSSLRGAWQLFRTSPLAKLSLKRIGFSFEHLNIVLLINLMIVEFIRYLTIVNAPLELRIRGIRSSSCYYLALIVLLVIFFKIFIILAPFIVGTVGIWVCHKQVILVCTMISLSFWSCRNTWHVPESCLGWLSNVKWSNLDLLLVVCKCVFRIAFILWSSLHEENAHKI